ncbi:GntP family permease [Pontibacter chinhatensis]|uniref:Gnt-I system low-affinity gluconate transporter n=1 Tax=Pontibacter chinhatensis TaxID=1436961 RepID=A0A1I2WQC5_9BACT|nr:gluconate:H+ symporter [Pontibacter chinhatensis]SFH02839.1 Gnt-I system low-affinity gluconate transporter [Pontibacter chinhatensis]
MIDSTLLFAVVAGIALLLLLILYFRLQAFLSLLIASIAVGLLAGMPAADIILNIQQGMGSTLGFIAVVVGLGAMFGAILESSGGVQSLAAFILQKTGEKRASWALAVTGFLVSIPVFFDVAFVILVPVVYALQKKTGRSLLFYGLPLLAGLAVTHAFIPPTPGPVAVADILGADLGMVIAAGFMAGIPATIVAGPLFASFISRRMHIKTPASFIEAEATPQKLPSPGMILGLLGLPLLLILMNTYLDSPLGAGIPLTDTSKSWIKMLGHPFVALILANLLAWYLLGLKRGFSRQDLLSITSSSLAPAGMIILITGAGGVFKQILTETGAGKMLAEVMTSYGLSAFLFAFLTAAAIRILQGSSTVAMITAAGMTAAFLEGTATSDMHRALMVIAIASGASILSHVNDSGFWLVSKYFGLTERQTLRSWTVMTTLIALTGFLMVLLLSMVL